MKSKTCKYALIGVVVGFMGVVFTSIAGLAALFGFFSLWRIGKSSGSLQGRMWALLAICLGIFGVLIHIGQSTMRQVSGTSETMSGTTKRNETSTERKSITRSDVALPITSNRALAGTSRSSLRNTISSIDTQTNTYDFDQQTAAIIRQRFNTVSAAATRYAGLVAVARAVDLPSQATGSIVGVDGVVYKSFGSNNLGLVVKDNEKMKTLPWQSLSHQTLSRLRPDIFSIRLAKYSNALNSARLQYLAVSNLAAKGMVLYRTSWTNRAYAVLTYNNRQHRIALQERQIWQEAYWNFERGTSEALIKYPADEDDTIETIRTRDKYAEIFEAKLNQAVCEKYEIDMKTLNEINDKGLKKYWPGETRPELKEKMQSDCGPQPKNDEWDAEVPEVVEYLRSQLNDPKVEYVTWYKPVLENRNGQYFWRVRVKFRAKNLFGAYRLIIGDFYIQHNRVMIYHEN